MDENLQEQKIYYEYYVKLEKADKVIKLLNIDRRQLVEYCKVIEKQRVEEIREMRRIRQLYNNKKYNNSSFSDFYDFYTWYIDQFHEQNGCCYYCETEENKIAALFEKKYKSAKRINRGKHLEVERRDSKKNEYSRKNCVLACYFCNNDKSDIFSEMEYLEYLKDRKSFFDKEYEKLK